ncbi:MAG: tRNA (adenosine(37)-N6)-threonylcarbamoyltransferase complex ATPase subunit type 1 TsaE [Actinomycetota bacterium]
MSGKDSLELSVPAEDQMHEFGVALGKILKPGDLVSLNGPLGAGKTTLTRGIGEGVGARGNISSPTFLIARTHETNSGTPFIHIDAYRLGGAAELDDLDIDFANSISVIEWGRGFTDGLVESQLEIDIDRTMENDERIVKLNAIGDRAKEIVSELGIDND